MTDKTKQGTAKQTAKPAKPKKTEAALDDKQLDQATGGTGCATGKHFPTATITV